MVLEVKSWVVGAAKQARFSVFKLLLGLLHIGLWKVCISADAVVVSACSASFYSCLNIETRIAPGPCIAVALSGYNEKPLIGIVA